MYAQGRVSDGAARTLYKGLGKAHNASPRADRRTTLAR